MKRGRRKGQSALGIQPEQHYGTKLCLAAGSLTREDALVESFILADLKCRALLVKIKGRARPDVRKRHRAQRVKEKYSAAVAVAACEAIRWGDFAWFERMAAAVKRHSKEITLSGPGIPEHLRKRRIATLTPVDPELHAYLVFIGDRVRRNRTFIGQITSDRTRRNVKAHFEKLGLPEPSDRKITRWNTLIGATLKADSSAPKRKQWHKIHAYGKRLSPEAALQIFAHAIATDSD